MNEERVKKLAHAALEMNEVGSRSDLKYKFSDPDGLRTGKSGYSFGGSQFDIENNWRGIECLRACGLRPKDLKRLYLQDSDIKDLDAKLKARAHVVDDYDGIQVADAFSHVVKLTEDMDMEPAEAVIVHLIDYHNQLFMSPGGRLHRYLKALGETITPEIILEFKLTEISWGRKRPDDVKRRFYNIQTIVKGAKL